MERTGASCRARLARGTVMAKVLTCECGYSCRAETDDELIALAEAHMREAHPDLVGKFRREDLLEMAEEE
jgi:predicted small metal-binding protein